MIIHVEIEGQTPLLMNRFTETDEVKLSSGTSPVYRPPEAVSCATGPGWTSGRPALPWKWARPCSRLNLCGC